LELVATLDAGIKFLESGKGDYKEGDPEEGSRTSEEKVEIFFSKFGRRQKTSVLDYEPIAIIGRGAFGEVRVCREKETGEIVAVKKMKKAEMLNKY
jgi:serine/threonine protein kinase